MHSQNELLSGRPSTFDFFVVFIWPVLTSPFLGGKKPKNSVGTVTKCSTFVCKAY